MYASHLTSFFILSEELILLQRYDDAEGPPVVEEVSGIASLKEPSVAMAELATEHEVVNRLEV